MKKQKKKLITILAIVLAIALVAYLSNKPLAIIMEDYRLFEISQVTSGGEFYVYNLQVAPSIARPASQVCSSDLKNYYVVSDSITWADGADNFAESGQGIDVEIPEDVELGKNFPITSVTYSGISVFTDSACSSSATPNMQDLGSYCTVNSKDSVTCYLSSNMTSGIEFRSKPFGTSLISINVNFYKVGYNLVNVYSLENNACLSKQVLEKDKESYYSTLEECQEDLQVIIPPKLNWFQRLNLWIENFFKRLFGL